MRWLLAAVCISFAADAQAHDWYPRSCCSDQDCYKLDPSEYEFTIEGIRIISTGEVIEHDKIRRNAPTGDVHRCSMLGDRNRRTITIGGSPCIWAPEAGL